SIVFISRFSDNFITNDNYLEFNEKDQVQINQSGFWNLTGNPIYIDGNVTGVGAHNWTWAEAQPWCYGSGTWSHPYIIENVTIDGQGSGNCIFIENSDVYFIIRNCTFNNSGSNNWNAGIKLANVDNGKIINNTCYDNFNGIDLGASHNNTLSGNNFSHNLLGIHILDSNNNRLSGNNASYNIFPGIRLLRCNNTILLGNTANNNDDHGINFTGNNNTLLGNIANNNTNGNGIFFSGNNYMLSGNIANYNSWWGILARGNNNTLSGNTANNNYDGIVLQNSNYNTLSGNTANNNSYDGINFSGNNNILSGNTASNNNEYGFYTSSSNNTKISGNTANNNNDDGIYLKSSNNNTISGNTANNNDGRGIYGWYCDNNTFSGNTARTDVSGIFIRNSNNNTLTGNTACNNFNQGIYLNECNNNTISDNIAFNNGMVGIEVHQSNSNTLSGNLANNTNGYGIYVYYSDNNIILGNTADNSFYDGIRLEVSNNNRLVGNNVSNNAFNGILLIESINNTLSGNLLYFCGISFSGSLEEVGSHKIDDTNLVNNKPIYYYVNELSLESSNFTNAGQIILVNCYNSKILGLNISDSGIFLYYCINNTLSGTFVSNLFYGIVLYYSENNTLSGNIINNNNAAIYLWYSNNNTLLGNTLNNNTGGIVLLHSNNNTLTENILYNNTFGIYLFSGSSNNLVYKNFFLKNGKHAEDWGTDNKWNNLIIGNYWDNHTSPDDNHDGIVDDIYTYIGGDAGSTDYLPIAEDGAPRISIDSPSNGDIFDINAPSFNVTVTDMYVVSIWYTFDGGLTNYTITGLTGTLNQTAWEALSEGNITIRFYANDIAGNIDSSVVIVYKDIRSPVISIIFPLTDGVFGLIAPNYNISIDEPNLDTIWYTLDGGITNYTITGLTGTLNQTAWEALSEGTITIRFYANDTAGKIGFKDLEIIKEIPEDLDGLPIISFGNYYILFILITILSLIILKNQKKKK
ncbi:MAG: NosD domain-containing protein, partial [Promethearchaeota archaeon]